MLIISMHVGNFCCGTTGFHVTVIIIDYSFCWWFVTVQHENMALSRIGNNKKLSQNIMLGIFCVWFLESLEQEHRKCNGKGYEQTLPDHLFERETHTETERETHTHTQWHTDRERHAHRETDRESGGRRDRDGGRDRNRDGQKEGQGQKDRDKTRRHRDIHTQRHGDRHGERHRVCLLVAKRPSNLLVYLRDGGHRDRDTEWPTFLL